MLTEMFKQIKVSFMFLSFFTLLTGLIYPLVVTGIAQLFFPWQANGSLIAENNQYIGSALIGQDFAGTNYFWGRPSATTPFPYNAASSSGSNLGPSNPTLIATVQARVERLQNNLSIHRLIPVDLVTASGSGLDPDISPLAAFYQIPRVAKATNISEQELDTMIRNSIRYPTFGLLGEPRVNVLALNMKLQKLLSSRAPVSS